MRTLLIFFCLVGYTLGAGSPIHIRVQTTMVEMPLRTYTELFNSQKSQTIYQATQQLIKDEKATLISSDILIARSGEKATSESVREFIFPTEYEPPGFTPPPPPATPQIRPPFSCSTTFETRNVGATLEIEPTANGQLIDLRLAPDWVFLSGFTVWQTHRDIWGLADAKLPEFYSYRTNTAITLVDNRYQHLCAFTPMNPQGKADYTRKVLLFVKATIIHVPSPSSP